MNPLTYLKHVREEFAHIVWPSTRKAWAHTLVVILIAVAIALIVGLFDYLFGLPINRVIGG